MIAESGEMPIEACVASLQAAGMALWVEDDQLRFLGVQELIDSAQFKILKAQKGEALALLASRPDLNIRAALVERREVATAPLTELQRRWSECRRLGGAVDNHIRLLLLKGRFNQPAFEASLKLLQERHSVLRMEIGVGPGGGFQNIVANPPPLRLDERTCQSQQIDDLAAAFGELPCDEANGQALRLLLLRLEEGGFALVLCASRLAFNWNALNILQRDLIRIYALLDAGAPPPPLVKTLRFLDYPLWQAERRTESPAAADWSPLKSMKGRTVNPRKKPRAKSRLDLPESATLAMLNRFRGRVSAPSVMMTVWSLALARLHRTDQVVSSVNVVDMPAVMQGVAGCFAGLAPLAADLAGGPNLAEALDRIAAIPGNGTDAFAVAPVEDMVRTGALAARFMIRRGGAPRAKSPGADPMFRAWDLDSPTMVEDIAAFCFLGKDARLLVHYASDIYSAQDMEEFQNAIVEIIENAAIDDKNSRLPSHFDYTAAQ